jgi:hypothetical protein
MGDCPELHSLENNLEATVSLISLVTMGTLLRAAVKSGEMKFLAERKVRLAFGSAILTLLVGGAISYRAAVYQG